MAEAENRERVLILTEQYRVVGDVQRGPDGSIWDFKHRPEERFLMVYDVQFFSIQDGKRAYDAELAEINKDHVVAVFREAHVAFMRKD